MTSGLEGTLVVICSGIEGFKIRLTLNFILSKNPSATTTSPSNKETFYTSARFNFILAFSKLALNNPTLSMFNLGSSVLKFIIRPQIL
jgi:hypothetical protein